MEVEMPKVLFSVKDAMQTLDLSRTTLWKAIKSGKLKKCKNVGRRVLFTWDALQEFARS